MGFADRQVSSLTIQGVASPSPRVSQEPENAAVGSPGASAEIRPLEFSSINLLERLFETPDPPARTISSYLDIEDIISLRNSCKLHRKRIQHGSKWGWMLHRLSTRNTQYPNPNRRRQRLTLGIPTNTRQFYHPGRQVVIVDVSIGDRDILKLNSVLDAVQAEAALTTLILDGTVVDAGDVGHLLKKYQNVTALSLRHCWNVNLQLLYKLFKKTPKEHVNEVNFYNHLDQTRLNSKCPAEQIDRLRIWDVEGIEPLLDERSENGYRLVSQISVQFFIRNFNVDIRRCENNHTVFMACVEEVVKCGGCNKLQRIQMCPKCTLKFVCEVCGEYLCSDCNKDQSNIQGRTGALAFSNLTATACRSPQCKWHENRHYGHPDCITKQSEKCMFCARHLCVLQRGAMDKSFMCEVCKKYSCGCRRLQNCNLCDGYMCDDCLHGHGRECQWRKG